MYGYMSADDKFQVAYNKFVSKYIYGYGEVSAYDKFRVAYNIFDGYDRLTYDNFVTHITNSIV